jgi:hypothetical protein
MATGSFLLNVQLVIARRDDQYVRRAAFASVTILTAASAGGVNPAWNQRAQFRRSRRNRTRANAKMQFFKNRHRKGCGAALADMIKANRRDDRTFWKYWTGFFGFYPIYNFPLGICNDWSHHHRQLCSEIDGGDSDENMKRGSLGDRLCQWQTPSRWRTVTSRCV